MPGLLKDKNFKVVYFLHFGSILCVKNAHIYLTLQVMKFYAHHLQLVATLAQRTA
jgi:hypothetical protein